MNIKVLSFLVSLLTSSVSFPQANAAFKIPSGMTPEKAADAVQMAHNLEAWWGKEIVKADVEIIFGGKTMVDGTFTFEAHGPKARYDRKDGVSIIFDGDTAWVTPAETVAPMGRFHVLTWPWFIMAPFKMKGEGIYLSELQKVSIEGKEYGSLFQTFAPDQGDTPDDWYRFFVNPKNLHIAAMSYIVTYGKDSEKANEKPSIIRYLDYENEGGPLISTRYEFWYWDPENKHYLGGTPKGTGTVSAIEYLETTDADFSIPENARELPLPKANN